MLMPTKTLWTKQLEQEIISNIKLKQRTQILIFYNGKDIFNA